MENISSAIGTASLAGRTSLAAKTKTKPQKTKFNVAPYLFLLPALLSFGVFVFFPFLKTIYLSGTITNASGQVKKVVGLQNFQNILTSVDFWTTLKTTFVFVPMVVIPSITLGLILALMASKKRKGSAVYEVLFSLPMAIASAAASIVWRYLFNPNIGPLNYFLGANINWLTDKKWALFSVALVTVWLQLGINFIFLVTGLRGIPNDINESAMIDGANAFQKFFKITLPMLSPTLFFVIFYNMMSSFQSFGQIRMLTQGGPGISTTVLVYSIYQEAFMNYRFGTAAAQSIILFVIMFIVTIIQFQFEDKGVHYN